MFKCLYENDDSFVYVFEPDEIGIVGSKENGQIVKA